MASFQELYGAYKVWSFEGKGHCRVVVRSEALATELGVSRDLGVSQNQG